MSSRKDTANNRKPARDENGRFAPKSPKAGAYSKKNTPRADAWRNIYTGLGYESTDKRLSSNPYKIILDNDTAKALWSSDPMAAKIVEMPADDMTRAGFEIVIEGDSKDLSEKLQSKWEEPDLDCVGAIRRAVEKRRALGGSAIYLGVDDGRDPSQPLDWENIRSFDFTTVLEPVELQAKTWYTDPLAPKYGQVATFTLHPLLMSADMAEKQRLLPKESRQFQVIHESRLCIFQGIQVTNERAQDATPNIGWGQSVLARCYEAIRDHNRAYSGTALLVEDFAQAVLKIKGLAELIAADGSSVLQGRVEGLNLCASQTNMRILDAEEEFERKATPLTGLKDVLDKLDVRLTAATEGIPLTLLMGISPGGMNSTGESDIRGWYDTVRSMQDKYVIPHLEKMTRLLMLVEGEDPEVWSVNPLPLWQESDSEVAEARNKQMQTDVGYINAGVLAADDVAESRFGGDKYSYETRITQMPSEFEPTTEEMAAQLALQAQEQELKNPRKPDQGNGAE